MKRDLLILDQLLRLGLPFVIRSPHSSRQDPPHYWTDAFDPKWLIEAVDHEKRDLFLGSGSNLSAAIEDLAEGLRKAGRELPAPDAALGEGVSRC